MPLSLRVDLQGTRKEAFKIFHASETSPKGVVVVDADLDESPTVRDVARPRHLVSI